MTERYYVCECGEKIWIKRLFEALKHKGEGGKTICKKCGGEQSINLKFDFQLDAEIENWKVTDCFTIASPWTARDGENVIFYPFLVMLCAERNKEKRVWFPYWHVVAGKRRYGQWAACLGTDKFKNLLEQARKKGYSI